MIITKRQLRRIIKEAQWGNFTGGAAPLDEPPLDSGDMDPEQQQKVFDILVSTGSDPKQLLASGEFPDVVVEMKVTNRQLRRIIKEKVARGSNVNFDWDSGGLSMVMYVDGKEVMSFMTQKEVQGLITQLEDLLAGPMRTSP